MLSRRILARAAMAIIPISAAIAPIGLPRVFAAAPVTIIADDFNDSPSPDCGDIHISGTCSLRGAIQRANSDNAGDTVRLLAGTYTLSLGSTNADDGWDGDLEVTTSMTITGAGAGQTTVQPLNADTWADRILEVDKPGGKVPVAPVVTISNLTANNGRDTGRYEESNGGGILVDGGTLTLDNLAVTNSTTLTDGGGVASVNGGLSGGHVTLGGNQAAGNGGGLDLEGLTTVANVFTNLLVIGNTAAGPLQEDSGGGGIYNGLFTRAGAGSVSFTDVMVLGNHATGMHGGGIYDDSVFPDVAYTNLTVAGNDARNNGGGVYLAFGRGTFTNATIANNTVTFNNVDTATQGRGGGIALGGRSPAATLNNVTLNGNHSPKAGAGIALLNDGDTAALHNTIVVGNTYGGATANCYKGGTSTITSTGHNIVDDTTCGLGGTADREGSSFNPNLGTLGDNKGPVDGAPGSVTSPTLTEALPASSIAIDTADTAICPGSDERHITRPQGGGCDVGAYEFEVAAAQAPLLPKAGARLAEPGILLPLAILLAVVLSLAGGAELYIRRAT